MRTLYRHARLATFDGHLPWGWIDDGALLVDGDRLAWVGADGELPTDLQPDAVVALDGALVTPGLVDCHTHLVYGGDRATEFELRLRGATYEQIAQAGGGIRSTLAATRHASDTALFEGAPRAPAA
jgi:imidazolonepropionase